jgi:hypothetical protein
MPIALDGETVDVYLESDKDKPAETRPAFVCRYMTMRQVLQYDKALKRASAEKDQESQNQLLNEALGIIIVSTKNMTGELDDLLSAQEKWELAYTAPMAVQLSEADKKKLLLKSRSIGANAEPAANETTKANGHAVTVPAPTPPSS